MSIRRTLRSARASAAARFTAVVVLPTPPFWFATAMILPTRPPCVPRETRPARVSRGTINDAGLHLQEGFSANVKRREIPSVLTFTLLHCIRGAAGLPPLG